MRDNQYSNGLPIIGDIIKQYMNLFNKFPKFTGGITLAVILYFIAPMMWNYFDKIKGNSVYYHYDGYYVGVLYEPHPNDEKNHDDVEFLDSKEITNFSNIFSFSPQQGSWNVYEHEKEIWKNNTFLLSIKGNTQPIYAKTSDEKYYRINPNQTINEISKTQINGEVYQLIKVETIQILKNLSFREGYHNDLISDDMKIWKDNHPVYSKIN